MFSCVHSKHCIHGAIPQPLELTFQFVFPSLIVLHSKW